MRHWLRKVLTACRLLRGTAAALQWRMKTMPSVCVAGVEHRAKVVQLRHRLDEHLLLRLQVCEQLGELTSARHLLDRRHDLLQPPLHRRRRACRSRAGTRGRGRLRRSRMFVP